MKKLSKVMLWMAILPLIFVLSCKDDDPAPVDAFSIMTDYMVSNDLDLPDVLGVGAVNWITARPATIDEVPAFISSHFIMDLRQSADFNNGHIEGAVNTTLGTIVADAANAGGKQILVVCYSGQSAGHGTVALRLSGFSDAQVLKWGMSGWTAEEGYDKWSGATASEAKASGNWTMDGTADLGTYEYPTLTSTSSDGATILAERITTMVAGGFKGEASDLVYGTPTNYHINNYWTQTDVDLYGNITSSNMINPLSLEGGNFKAYDPAATNITYCWTGQTSSIVTAYLTVLGYDAKSLKNGVNSMIYDDLQGHKWSPPTVNYPIVGQ